MLDFKSWKDGIQELFKDPVKHNQWIGDDEYCPSCRKYIYGIINYESLTSCPYCNRSFVD